MTEPEACQLPKLGETTYLSSSEVRWGMLPLATSRRLFTLGKGASLWTLVVEVVDPIGAGEHGNRKRGIVVLKENPSFKPVQRP